MAGEAGAPGHDFVPNDANRGFEKLVRKKSGKRRSRVGVLWGPRDEVAGGCEGKPGGFPSYLLCNRDVYSRAHLVQLVQDLVDRVRGEALRHLVRSVGSAGHGRERDLLELRLKPRSPFA